MELQARLNHTRVIIHKECTGSDVVAHVEETIFAHLSIAIDQQFAMVPFSQRVFGDAFVRQGVVVISYIDW